MTIALWRDRLAYQPLSLGFIALVTSFLLFVGNQMTRDAVARAEHDDLQRSLQEVLPPGYADNALLADAVDIAQADGAPVTVYRARRNGEVKGAVFRMAARGYAGDVVVLIGVDTAGTLLAARVIKHQETPGLGDKIDVAKTRWIDGFAGKSLASPPPERWAVRKDGGVFDQFAGATITPRAVVKAVKQGLEFYAGHREEIVSAPADSALAGDTP
jgi:electron transport complex protein RnfG